MLFDNKYLVTPLKTNFFIDFHPENRIVFNKIWFLDTSSLSLAFQSYVLRGQLSINRYSLKHQNVSLIFVTFFVRQLNKPDGGVKCTRVVLRPSSLFTSQERAIPMLMHNLVHL